MKSNLLQRLKLAVSIYILKNILLLATIVIGRFYIYILKNILLHVNSFLGVFFLVITKRFFIMVIVKNCSNVLRVKEFES